MSGQLKTFNPSKIFQELISLITSDSTLRLNYHPRPFIDKTQIHHDACSIQYDKLEQGSKNDENNIWHLMLSDGLVSLSNDGKSIDITNSFGRQRLDLGFEAAAICSSPTGRLILAISRSGNTVHRLDIFRRSKVDEQYYPKSIASSPPWNNFRPNCIAFNNSHVLLCDIASKLVVMVYADVLQVIGQADAPNSGNTAASNLASSSAASTPSSSMDVSDEMTISSSTPLKRSLCDNTHEQAKIHSPVAICAGNATGELFYLLEPTRVRIITPIRVSTLRPYVDRKNPQFEGWPSNLCSIAYDPKRASMFLVDSAHKSVVRIKNSIATMLIGKDRFGQDFAPTAVTVLPSGFIVIVQEDSSTLILSQSGRVINDAEWTREFMMKECLGFRETPLATRLVKGISQANILEWNEMRLWLSDMKARCSETGDFKGTTLYLWMLRCFAFRRDFPATYFDENVRKTDIDHKGRGYKEYMTRDVMGNWPTSTDPSPRAMLDYMVYHNLPFRDYAIPAIWPTLLLDEAYKPAIDLKDDLVAQSQMLQYLARSLDISSQTQLEAFLTKMDVRAFQTQNAFGRTPVHEAAYRGNAALLKCIWEKKIPLLEKDMLGRTALHYAAMNDHVHILRFFEAEVGCTADQWSLPDSRYRTAAQYAKINMRHDTMRWMSEKLFYGQSMGFVPGSGTISDYDAIRPVRIGGNSLPDYVWGYISTYFDSSELLQLRLICKLSSKILKAHSCLSVQSKAQHVVKASNIFAKQMLSHVPYLSSFKLSIKHPNAGLEFGEVNDLFWPDMLTRLKLETQIFRDKKAPCDFFKALHLHTLELTTWTTTDLQVLANLPANLSVLSLPALQTEFLVRVLPANLTSLNLKSCVLSERQFQPVPNVPLLPMLTKLKISQAIFSEKLFKLLPKNLTHLDMQKMDGIGREAVALLPDTITKLNLRYASGIVDHSALFFPKSLVHLDVNFNSNLSNHFFVRLASIVEHQTTLEVIRAEASNTTINVIPHLELLTKLKRIHLSVNFTKNLTMYHIDRLPKSLEKLDLYHNQIVTTSTLSALERSTLSLPTALTSLHWSTVENFQESDFELLPTTLTRLHLGRCENIDPKGFKRLKACKGLVELNIKQAKDLTPEHLNLLPPTVTKLKLPRSIMHSLRGYNFYLLSRFHLTTLSLETEKVTSACFMLLPHTIRSLTWRGLITIYGDHVSYLPPYLEHLSLPTVNTDDRIASSLPHRLRTLDLPASQNVTPLSVGNHSRLQNLTLGFTIDSLRRANLTLENAIKILPANLQSLQLPELKTEKENIRLFNRFSELEFLVVGPGTYYPSRSLSPEANNR